MASATEVDKVVLQYLRYKGYADTASHFEKDTAASSMKKESKTQDQDDSEVNLKEFAMEVGLTPDTFAQNHVFFWGINQGDASRYETEYNELETWIAGSLDLYKPELVAVRYPLFVHCFLDLLEKGFDREAGAFWARWGPGHRPRRAAEVDALGALGNAQEARASPLARRLRRGRWALRLCPPAYDLLNGFLAGRACALLAGLLNARARVRVEDRPPRPDPQEAFLAPDDAEAQAALRGPSVSSSSCSSLVAARPVRWGVLAEAGAGAALRAAAAAGGGGGGGGGGAAAAAEVVRGGGGPLPDLAAAYNAALADRLVLQRLGPREAWGARAGGGEDDDERAALERAARAARPSALCVTFLRAAGALNCGAFADDGLRAAAGFQDGSVRVWRLDGRAVDEGLFGGDDDGAAAMDTAGGEGGTTGPPAAPPPPPGPAETPEPALVLRGHAAPCYALSWAPDRRFLLSAGGDGAARLWDTAGGRALAVYRGHATPVWDAALAPTGYYFATAGYDHTCRMWATDRLEPLRLFVGHLSDVTCTAWHPNCNYVVSGSTDKSVRLWDVQSGEACRVLTGPGAPVRAAAVCPQGRRVAAAAEDGTVRVWDVATGKQMAALAAGEAASGGPCALAWSAGGGALAAAGGDGVVRVWDAAAGALGGGGGGGEGGGAAAAAAAAAGAAGAGGGPRPTCAFETKNTPVFALRYTRRNLLLVGGTFVADPSNL